MSMLSRYASLAAPAAGIQFVGRTTAGITGSGLPTDVSLTSLTGGLASAPVEGDLVIVYYGTGSNADRAIGVTTADYTEVAELYSDDTYDTNLSVSYKFMGATPDTQVQVSATGQADDSGAVAIHVWRGVDPVLPLSVVSTTATGVNSVLCNPPAITPVTTGAVIVSGGAGGHVAGVRTYSSSNLSNFATIGGPEDTYDVTVGVGSAVWTSGAFDPAAFTFSGTDSTQYSWAAVTMALRPDQNQPGPILISQASTSGSNQNDLTINKPTGTREGDLMVAVVNNSNTCTWTGDTGWTEVADQGTGAATRIAYKVAGASEGASYAFTQSADGQSSGTIVTYRNAAYDAVGTITSGTDPLVLSSVTASVTFSRILATVARSSASITITGPATMQTIAIDNDATDPSRLVEQDDTLSLAGASGTRSFTMGSTSNVSGALVAIKPAASYTKYAQYMASASGSASGFPGTTVTVSTPACVPGNLLLFVTSSADSGDAAVTFSTPSGWTLLTGNSTGVNNYQPSMYVFYRIADGSEAASYTATASANADSSVGVMLRLAGVDPSTLTAGTTSTGLSTTSITATGVTATANGILLYFGAQSNNSAPVTFTPPSGMTEAIERSGAALSGANAELTVEAAYQEGLSAGATGSKTATASAAAEVNRFRAILVTVDAI